jgi:hypothetical protein
LLKGTLVFVPAMLGGMTLTRLITNTWLRAKTLVSVDRSLTQKQGL